jgi:hypothetical protein
MIDMSSAGVDRRLRKVARLAARQVSEASSEHAPIKHSSRTRLQPMLDMSDQAIDRRLREVEELRHICLQLGRLKPL